MKKLILLLLLPFIGWGQVQLQSYTPTYEVYKQSAPVAFEAEYQAVLDYADGQGWTKPSASQQILQNAMVASIKAAGKWDSLDVFYVFANDGSADFGRINWAAPGNFTATITAGISWTSDEGFTGGASTDRISTGFDPSAQDQKVTAFGVDSCSYGFWAFDIGTGTDYLTGDFSFNLFRQSGATTRITSAVSSTVAAPSDGWTSLHRYSFTNFKYNTNGTITDHSANGTADKTGLANEEFEILNRANTNSGSNATMSVWYIGGYLISSDLRNAVTTYMNSL